MGISVRIALPYSSDFLLPLDVDVIRRPSAQGVARSRKMSLSSVRPPGSCRPHSRQPRSSLSPHDALVDIVRSAITDRLDQAAYGAVLAREEAVEAELRRVLLPALHRIPGDHRRRT